MNSLKNAVPFRHSVGLIFIALMFTLASCNHFNTIQTVQITAEDMDDNPVVFDTAITVRGDSSSCEFRLEFNDSGNISWGIREISGNQGPAQRYSNSPCSPAMFNATPGSSLREFEEQTIYYWTKRARDYSVENLWITPLGWTGNPIPHAGDMLGPGLLTQGEFQNLACYPQPLAGCMRVWPHEGPKTHFLAGRVSDDLVAHEYGHYAAGFVFGHMDVFGINGFDITNCAKRSFQEAIAESFERLFLHHVANEGTSGNGPGVNEFNSQWQNSCGSTDYIMGNALWQSIDQSVWGVTSGSAATVTVHWTSPQDANKAMINAFSYALAVNRGHRIHKLAHAMLEHIQANQIDSIYNEVLAIFASHGMAPTSLGGSCINHDECASQYCDHGNGTSHTDQCMPGANMGNTGDICSNNNQCVSNNCLGVTPRSDGSWNPGSCN